MLEPIYQTMIPTFLFTLTNSKSLISHLLAFAYKKTKVTLEQEMAKTTLFLKRPAEAFSHNLRAYIFTVLPALKCSMDFQTTDNRAMLLRYVTSYVTKWRDGMNNDSLYSSNITGGQAAIRYVHRRIFRFSFGG